MELLATHREAALFLPCKEGPTKEDGVSPLSMPAVAPGQKRILIASSASLAEGEHS